MRRRVAQTAESGQNFAIPAPGPTWHPRCHSGTPVMTVRSKFVWASLILSVVGACSGRPAARDTRTVPAPGAPAAAHAAAARSPAPTSAAVSADPHAGVAKTATG